MRHSYPERENIAFPSSGDAEEDQRQLEAFHKRDRLLAEGLCANGCGPLVVENPHNRSCSKCGFHQWSNVPFEEATPCEQP